MPLIRRIPWRVQPQSAAALTGGDLRPIAAAIPRGGYVETFSDYLHEKTARPNGTGVRTAAGQLGYGVGSTASSTNVLRLHSVGNATTTVWERPTAQVSLLLYFIRYGNAGGNAPMFGNLAASTDPFTAWGLVDQGGTGTLRFETAAGGGGSYAALDSSVAMTNNRPTVAIATYDGATKRLFMGGVQVGSAAETGTLTYPADTDRGPALGNYWNFTGSSRSFVGDIYLAALWDRGLTLGEVAALSANPWDVFEPRRIWVPVSAGAGGDLTLNLSGQSVTSASGSFTLNNAFSLSGQQASISAGTLAYVLSKALAGDSVSSSAGTLTQSHSNALSGQASTISAGTLIGDHSTGVSGQAVTISSGNLSAINSLAITGTAVTGSAGTLAHERSLGLSGIEITVLAGTITYGAGGDLSIALTGQSLTASAGTLLTSSALGLSGQGVTVALGNILGANSLGISGQSVTTSAGTFTLARTVVLDGEEVISLLGTITGDGVPTGVTIYYWQRTA